MCNCPVLFWDKCLSYSCMFHDIISHWLPLKTQSKIGDLEKSQNFLMFFSEVNNLNVISIWNRQYIDQLFWYLEVLD